MQPTVADSARKRLSDERVLAAYRNTAHMFARGADEIRLGHDDNGVPIELGVTYRYGPPVIFHAMRMRKRWQTLYRRYL